MAEWKTAGKVRMTPKGVHDSTIAYNILDLVSNEDHTMYYIAKQDVPANTLLTNTDYWDVVMNVSDVPDQIETLDEKADGVQESSDDLKEYVRGLSPVNTKGPLDVISIDDAAPLDVENVVISIEPVQSGSGDPAPDNVRPITGWTGANVTRAGKNLAPVNTFVASHNTVMTFVPNLPAGVYKYSYKATRTGTDSRNGAIRFTYDDGTYIQEYLYVDGAIQTKGITFVKPVASIYIYSVSGSYSDSGNLVLTATDFQIELGSTATPYEPYQGNTYSVDWEDEAGTIYGGTLDLTAGTLTVDRAIVDLGTLNYGVMNSRFSADVIGMTPVVTPPYTNRLTGVICSQYPPDSQVSISDTMTDKTWIRTGAGIIIKDTDYTDAASFKSAMSGVQLVYPLATPVTYTIDPMTLTLLRGNNALWADCGDTTLTYRQDVATVLEALLSPDETDMVANTNYVENSFFTIGGKLYKATSAIATGETIQPGTNCVETSISEQLTAIYSQLS